MSVTKRHWQFSTESIAFRSFHLVFLLAVFLFSSCTASYDRADATDIPYTRVLFMGNSYIYSNKLPNTFAELAKAGNHTVEVEMSAQAGWTLTHHVQSADTLEMLNSTKWDYVVLQEQSQIPAIPDDRTSRMYPAARILVQEIENAGATPLFFLTWGHRRGLRRDGMPNYESMQAELNNGYYGIAEELNAPVAPVGIAWQKTVQEHPELTLWQDDGSHPSAEGTYLAACVFYAVIFNESPVGLTYPEGLSRDTAEILQTIAAQTVLDNP